jgi:hypothetical protein
MPRARSKMTANVRKLAEERDRLLREIAAIQVKVDGLELAMSVLQRGTDEQISGSPSGLIDRLKRATKDLLLELLHEVRGAGLNATTAVELAAKRDIGLVRGSAASTLSRMKAEGIVTHDGKVYRLPEYSRPQLEIHAGGKSL